MLYVSSFGRDSFLSASNQRLESNEGNYTLGVKKVLYTSKKEPHPIYYFTYEIAIEEGMESQSI